MKCAIQWIDCHGEPTPDDNPAVGLATITINGEARSYPICAEHAAGMGRARCHHGHDCHHVSRTPAHWTLGPLPGSVP
jgi:hypothetical protein